MRPFATRMYSGSLLPLTWLRSRLRGTNIPGVLSVSSERARTCVSGGTFMRLIRSKWSGEALPVAFFCSSTAFVLPATWWPLFFLIWKTLSSSSSASILYS